MYVNNNNVTCFDSFGVEDIPNKIRKFIGNKNIITNIYRIQAFNSEMCGYFSIEFIAFMLNSQSFLDYTNLFSPNQYWKNKKQNNSKIFLIIKNYFCEKILKRLRWEKSIVLIVKSIKNLKILECHIFVRKHYFFLVFVTSVELKMKKYLKKTNQMRY